MWLQALQEEVQAQKVKMKQEAAGAEGTRGLALPRATWPQAQAILSTALGLNWLICKNGRKKETGWYYFKWLGRAASFLENICEYKSSDALKVHLWEHHTAPSPWVGGRGQAQGPCGPGRTAPPRHSGQSRSPET